MSHLTVNALHWYLASPTTIEVTIPDTTHTDLSSLGFVIAGVLEITDGVTTADASGDAVVSVPVAAADTEDLSAGVYGWQLQGSVSGSGPRVLAVGTLRLDDLADGPESS